MNAAAPARLAGLAGAQDDCETVSFLDFMGRMYSTRVEAGRVGFPMMTLEPARRRCRECWRISTPGLRRGRNRTDRISSETGRWKGVEVPLSRRKTGALVPPPESSSITPANFPTGAAVDASGVGARNLQSGGGQSSWSAIAWGPVTCDGLVSVGTASCGPRHDNAKCGGLVPSLESSIKSRPTERWLGYQIVRRYADLARYPPRWRAGWVKKRIKGLALHNSGRSFPAPLSAKMISMSSFAAGVLAEIENGAGTSVGKMRDWWALRKRLVRICTVRPPDSRRSSGHPAPFDREW